MAPAAGSAAAQAWTRPPGSLYAKVSYGTSTAADQFAFDGTRRPYADNVPGDAYFDRSLYIYGELGLFRRLTAVVSVPYKRLFVRDAAFKYRTFGPGSAGLGLRWGLIAGGPNVVSANVSVDLPMGNTRNLAPSTGAGQIDLSGALAYGRSFYPTPAYLQANVGYRHRSAWYGLSRATDCQLGVDLDCVQDTRPDYGDEMFYSLEAGLTPGRALFQVLVAGVRSITAPDTGFRITSPLPTRQRFVRLGGGVGVRTGFGVGFSAQSLVTVAGRNTVRAIDVILGIELVLP